jgi:hypothetical protein
LIILLSQLFGAVLEVFLILTRACLQLLLLLSERPLCPLQLVLGLFDLHIHRIVLFGKMLILPTVLLQPLTQHINSFAQLCVLQPQSVIIGTLLFNFDTQLLAFLLQQLHQLPLDLLLHILDLSRHHPTGFLRDLLEFVLIQVLGLDELFLLLQ